MQQFFSGLKSFTCWDSITRLKLAFHTTTQATLSFTFDFFRLLKLFFYFWSTCVWWCSVYCQIGYSIKLVASADMKLSGKDDKIGI
jgi:hypothetical protein